MGEGSGRGTVEGPDVGAGGGPHVELAHARLRDASCIIVGQPLLDQGKAKARFIEAITEARGEGAYHMPIIVIPSEESRGSWSHQEFRTSGFTQVYEVQRDESPWGPDGMIGDVLGWAIAHQRGLEQPSESKVVFTKDSPRESILSAPICFGGLGSTEVQNGLRIGAGFAGLPLVSIGRDGGEPFVDSPPEATLSAVLEAYRLSLSTLAGEPKDVFARIREVGGWTLLRCVEDRVRTTNLLMGLLFDQANDIYARPDYHSMCADLLDRRGWHGESAALRRLIKHWRAQNLWSANLVPEMVLHDAAHSQSVDRIMACLCEPLLSEGKIDQADLVILACAAWLHDWGCVASARMVGGLLTDPRDIRAFHGYLSMIRLKKNPTKHQLDKELGFKNTINYRTISKFGSIADQVGLISAHHVGSTSAGGGLVCEKNQKPILQWGYEGQVVYTDKTDPTDRDEIVVQPFDDDYGFTLPDGLSKSDIADGLRRAHHRLALLRIADAIDAGWHRIPNFETQSSDRLDVALSFFAPHDRVAHILTEIVQGVDPGFSWGAVRGVPPLEGVKSDFKQRLKDPSSEGVDRYPAWAWRPKATVDVIPNAGIDSKIFSIMREYYFKTVKDAAILDNHLIEQADYYSEQRQLRAVFPVLVPDGNKRFDIRLDALIGLGEPSKAEQTLRALFLRELGYAVTRMEKPQPVNSDQKPIAEYLDELGINVPKKSKKNDLPVTIWPQPEEEPYVEPPARPIIIKPLTAIPNGWGGWWYMDHGCPRLNPSGAPPRDCRPLASCVDKTVIVGVDGVDVVSNKEGLGGRLLGHSYGTGFEALAINEGLNTLVVRVQTPGGWQLREYYSDGDGRFDNPETLEEDHAENAVRALYLPHQGHEDLFVILNGGQILEVQTGLSKGHGFLGVTHIEHMQLHGLDAVRQEDGSMWVSYITHDRFIVKRYDPVGEPLPVSQSPRDYHPSEVWFAPVRGKRPVIIIEDRNDKVGDGRPRYRSRSFRVPEQP